MTDNEHWWCPACAKVVHGSEVTYQEYHICGCYLGDCQEDTPKEKYEFVQYVFGEITNKIINLQKRLDKTSWVYDELKDLQKFVFKALHALEL